MDGPVIAFRTAERCYLYDAATNHIARVREAVYRIAAAGARGETGEERPWRHCGLRPEAWRRGLAFLAALRAETGVAVPQQPRRVVARLEGSALALLPQSLHSLTLTVTEACNLRCSYCVYSGRYPGRRTHGVRSMPWEIAERAIDFLAAHSSAAARSGRSLGWYGGEPFLNFPLIRRSAAYFQSVFPDRDVSFHASSNGTRWNDEILDFLAANDVFLLVSLDGPAELHDRHRRTARGRGTFRTVMEGLARLRARHPAYTADRVKLNAVAAPPLDLAALDRFFAPLGLGVTLSTPEPASLAAADLQIAESAGWREVRDKFVRGCLEHRFDRPGWKEAGYGFVFHLFARDLQRIHRRRIRPGFEEEVSGFGCCVPGSGRLLVGVDGGFETCEKTDGTPWMRLGDLDTGVLPQRVAEIYRRFHGLPRDECRACFNVRFCDLCFAHPLHDGRLEPRKLRWACEAQRLRRRAALSLYCEILEQDPTALDFLRGDSAVG